MANFNKGVQQVAGLIGLAGGLLGSGSSIRTPTPEQQEFDTVRAGVRANIRKYGIQKPSFAFSRFELPKIFDQGVNIDRRELQLLCSYRADSFTQPGVQFALTDIKRYGVGTIERKPTVPLFIDVPFSFINDSDGVIRKFFYLWMNGIIGFDELPRANAAKDSFGKLPFDQSYKDEYQTDIEIIQFNEVNNKVQVVKLYNAYPYSMTDINNNWASENTFTQFQVSFTYTHWAIEDIDLQLREPKRSATGDLTLFQNLIRSASLLQTISSVKKPQNINDVINVVNTGATTIRSMTGTRLEY
jgi:hypothetical protein